MKRLMSVIALLAVLCAAFGAAGESFPVTIEDIMAANTGEAVLARHRNGAEHLITEDGSRVIYVDGVNRYEHFLPRVGAGADTEYEILLTADGAVMYDAGYKMYYCVVNVGLGYERKYTPDDEQNGTLAYSPEATALETVVDVEDLGDSLRVTTETEAGKLNALSYGLPDDGVYVVEYTVDKNTLEILGTHEYVRRADGKREQEMEQKLMYDISPTDDILTMIQAADAVVNSEPKRTLTFITDPGSDTEKITKVTRAAGVFVTWWADEKGYEAYADPEGKTPWQDDYTGDQTVYLINPMRSGVSL